MYSYIPYTLDSGYVHTKSTSYRSMAYAVGLFNGDFYLSNINEVTGKFSLSFVFIFFSYFVVERNTFLKAKVEETRSK